MTKIDDLLQSWAKQVVLTVVARLAHRLSPTANLTVEGITKRPNPDPNARNRGAHQAFLQNRLLAHVKSSRSVNRFRILHGRLITTLSRRTSIFLVLSLLSPIPTVLRAAELSLGEIATAIKDLVIFMTKRGDLETREKRKVSAALQAWDDLYRCNESAFLRITCRASPQR